MTEADRRAALIALLRADALRMRLLRDVEILALPDGWIGAGFVRAAVWDHAHDRPPAAPSGDVDVVWFDPARASPDDDAFEAALRLREPGIDWSVKNQAHMHARNGDAPYRSTAEAIQRWPETATAVAVRLAGPAIEVLAPHGLADLFALTIRPTPAFAGDKRAIVRARLHDKGWPTRWPRIIADADLL